MVLATILSQDIFHGHFKTTEVATFQFLSAELSGERSTSDSLILFLIY